MQLLRARKKNCQNVRKKEVEKLRAKKPPRAHCAQVHIPNPRKLDPSSLACAHRNLLSRSLGVGRSCPCFPRCLPCYPQLSCGVTKWSLVVAPWFLLIFSERQSTGFPTPGFKESSSSCSWNSRVCVSRFLWWPLCKCRFFDSRDVLPVLLLCLFLLCLCFMSSFFLFMFFLMC